MLTLNDGRSELWQWDTGRKLTVDADCSQVHFSNKVFGRSIDVDVADGTAIIPDILLQTDKDLNVWAFVGTAESGYTKISKTFKVNRRNKPADYVFTPPEQTTLAELVGRLDKIEESQDPDAIKNAVEDYLERNPVESPVQSVNGQTGTVELTAEDVGAISLDDLQEATNEALTQAKASGEFDGADGQDGKDGYTPIKGVDYFDGQPGKDGADGKDGEDYVLTNEDKQEIAEMAAELVDVPDSGGNVAYDEAQTLTDEQKAQARENIGAQPKGNYLTEVPDGYAKTEDVPTDAEIIQLIKDNAPKPSDGGIAVTGAKVGQTVKISAVDENGVPTAWMPTDFPSGGGGAKLALMNVVEVTDADVLRIDVTEAADGVPLADLGITKFVTFVSAAYGTKPSYTNYMTVINGKDFNQNKALTDSLNGIQRRSYCEFIGSGTVWTALSESNGFMSPGTVGFAGRGDASNWTPGADYGEKLDSFSIYLYNGSFKVGTKIMLWGC